MDRSKTEITFRLEQLAKAIADLKTSASADDTDRVRAIVSYIGEESRRLLELLDGPDSGSLQPLASGDDKPSEDPLADYVERAMVNPKVIGAVLAAVLIGAISLAIAWGVREIRYRGHGLKGEYFSDSSLQKPFAERTDHNIDFQWSHHPPFPRLAQEHFSVRWTGFLQAPMGGRYTFFTRADDGARLWIDDRLVINDWVEHPATVTEGKVSLSAGRHAIRLEYFQSIGNSRIRLLWMKPDDTSREVVSPIYLTPS